MLNDVADKADSTRKPNANVYYEYGLMTSFGKKIIPIQLEGQSLAFNIQSLDTLKYTKKDFGRQIEESIKITLLPFEEEEERVSISSNLEWTLDIMGLVKTDHFDFRHGRALSLRSLGFELYSNPTDGKMFFVGLFGNDFSDRDIVLNSKILTLRIKNYCEQLAHEVKEIKGDMGEKRRMPLIEERLLGLNRVKKRFQESQILVLY